MYSKYLQVCTMTCVYIDITVYTLDKSSVRISTLTLNSLLNVSTVHVGLGDFASHCLYVGLSRRCSLASLRKIHKCSEYGATEFILFRSLKVDAVSSYIGHCYASNHEVHPLRVPYKLIGDSHLSYMAGTVGLFVSRRRDRTKL